MDVTGTEIANENGQIVLRFGLQSSYGDRLSARYDLDTEQAHRLFVQLGCELHPDWDEVDFPEETPLGLSLALLSEEQAVPRDRWRAYPARGNSPDATA